jgi:hypothetical protein
MTYIEVTLRDGETVGGIIWVQRHQTGFLVLEDANGTSHARLIYLTEIAPEDPYVTEARRGYPPWDGRHVPTADDVVVQLLGCNYTPWDAWALVAQNPPPEAP